MIELVTPNPERHKYVIGIDIGHGETSAAYCTLDWEKSAGQSDIDPEDICILYDKVIVSAISVVDGDNPLIGREAISTAQVDKEAKMHICFKEPPVNVDGEKEKLMIQYIKAVYDGIKTGMKNLTHDKFTDENHIVYLARPSGWHKDKTQEVYMEMAKRAGIPLGGLTSESRAALFSALNNPKDPFIRKIEEGVIVVDLGSSTLDFTYYAKKQEPIDAGFPNGASIVEKAIYEDKIRSNTGVQDLLNKYPQYEDVLLFKAREIKEKFYSQNNDYGIYEDFTLTNILSPQTPEFDRFKDVTVEVDYKTKDELHQLINSNKYRYITELENKMLSFRNNNIEGKDIYGVFLTGGASRMGFVKDSIMKVYGLPDNQVHRDENPSLTISRGIAMLGRADCITNILRNDLLVRVNTIEIKDVYEKFTLHLSEQIKEEVWQLVALELSRFKLSSKDLSIADLENKIHSAFNGYSMITMGNTFNNSLYHIIEEKSNEIRNELNQIIQTYSFGAELEEIYKNHVVLDISSVERQLKKLTDRIVDMLIERLQDDILFKVLKNLFNISYSLYKLGKSLFYLVFKTEEEIRNMKHIDKEKRKKKTLSISQREKFFNDVMKESENMKQDIINDLHTSLSSDKHLKEEFEPIIVNRIKKYIQDNIESVCIPIK